MSFRRTTAILAQLALITTFVVAHPEVEANGGRNLIKTDDMREWLTYLSSDELEGRRTFSEGLGLAAAYIAAQLKSWIPKFYRQPGPIFASVKVTTNDAPKVLPLRDGTALKNRFREALLGAGAYE